MNLEQQLQQLTHDFVVMAGKLEQRAKRSEQTSAQSAQALSRTENTLQSMAQDIQRITSSTLGNAMQKPVGDLGESLKNISNEMHHASDAVAKRLSETTQSLRRVVWMSVGTFGLTVLLCLGVLVYAGMQARQQVKNADWIGSINGAIANGKLTACPGADGGICAVADKKLIRLDR